MTQGKSHPSVSSRVKVSLDGDWEFVTDPNTKGEKSNWHEPGKEWPERTRTVTVPHTWQEHDSLIDYTGTAWYRRTIDDQEIVDNRDAILRFDAVDYKATVWVNGVEVGTNRGGYLPFEFNVSDEIWSKENHVVVAVTDPQDLSEIPHGKQGDPWYTRVSGIWQSVSLDFRPRTRVTGAEVTPQLATDEANVELSFTLDNIDAETVECLVAARLDGETIETARTLIEAKDNTEVETDTVLAFDEPAYWSPNDPTLYELDVRLIHENEILDRYIDTFGFRSIDVKDGEFRFNGERFTIRGVLEQGYYPQTQYRPRDLETFEEEIRTAKNLGFNLIRKHIKPAHPKFLELADRLGILVWEELANPSEYSDQSKNEIHDQLHGLIERDYNHPCVIIWSLYNEEWGIGHDNSEETLWTDKEKQEYLRKLYEETKQLDETRLVCDNSGWAHVATDINDYHEYYIAPDRAEQWVDDLIHISNYPQDNYATLEYSKGEEPIVISEMGAWGLCNISAIAEHYDGNPNWFDHDFLNGLKRPAGVRDRFEESHASNVFSDFNSLVSTWQWRQLISIKYLIETLRARPSINGYVLTQLSDVEWEFSGILNYLREKKGIHDDFAAVNGTVTVVGDLISHVGWRGNDLPVTVTLINDDSTSISGTVKWSIGEQSGSMEVSIPAHEVVEVTKLDLQHPQKGHDITKSSLSLKFKGSDHEVKTNVPVYTVDSNSVDVPEATVYATGCLGSRLAGEGFDVTHDLSADVDVAFTDVVTTEFDHFADQGGAVIHIPSIDGEMKASGPFTYKSLPQQESWERTTSIFYQDTDLLSDICDSPQLGWVFEDLYPSAVATNLNLSVDRVHVGYFEGWLKNRGSPLVVRGYGSGSMTALTFGIGNTYGDHPIATLLCNRLVQLLIE